MQIHVFGPVLFYDMIRTARRGRYVLMRFIYALITFALLTSIYLSMFSYLDIQSLKPSQTTQFAETFFNWFMILQFILILLLTPAYVASAIAEEKDRRTLEFIFATDLKNQEIVFSKLFSRMANLVLFLLAGLPILSMIQLFGGINPQYLYGGFIATTCTLFSVASLSMLISVYAKRTRDAISFSYLLIIGYFMFDFLFLYFMFAMEQISPMKGALSTRSDFFDLALAWLFEITSAGNIVLALMRLGVGRIYTVVNVGTGFYDLLRNYSLFHIAVGLLCTVWATLSLRYVYRKQNFGTTVAKATAGKEKARRPIFNRPVLWKELHIHVRMTRFTKVLYILFVLGCLSPLGFVIYYSMTSYYRSSTWEQFRESINIYIRIVGTIVGCITLLALVVRSASMITHEREKQTLDSLLVSPLQLREIIIDKWWGSLWGVKPLLYLLMLLWLIGWMTGGLHWSTLIVLPLSFFVFMMFFAALGLFASSESSTSLRALMLALGWTIFIGGVHWVFCAFPILFLFRGYGSEYVAFFFAGLTPPAVLGWLAYSHDQIGYWLEGYGHYELKFFGFSIFGLLVFATLTKVLLSFAVHKFIRASGRINRFGRVSR